MNILDNIRIKKFLQKHEIKNYTIRKNGIIDVDGDVKIIATSLKSIPYQFGIIKGFFDCSYNKLTTLKGCDKVISLEKNNTIKTLAYEDIIGSSVKE